MPSTLLERTSFLAFNSWSQSQIYLYMTTFAMASTCPEPESLMCAACTNSSSSWDLLHQNIISCPGRSHIHSPPVDSSCPSVEVQFWSPFEVHVLYIWGSSSSDVIRPPCGQVVLKTSSNVSYLYWHIMGWVCLTQPRLCVVRMNGIIYNVKQNPGNRTSVISLWHPS